MLNNFADMQNCVTFTVEFKKLNSKIGSLRA